jgi:hypothetical protein
VHTNITDVPTPAEFDLPYTDLTLTAPDGTKLKAYLLTQKVHLDIHGTNPLKTWEDIPLVNDDDTSNDDIDARVRNHNATSPLPFNRTTNDARLSE